MHLDLNYTESPEYQEYLSALQFFRDSAITKPNVATRTLNINGKEYKMGMYGSISDRMQELQKERTKLVFEYRALLNAFLFSTSGHATMRSKIDNVAGKLVSAALEMENLTAYRETLANASATSRAQGLRRRAELAKKLPKGDDPIERMDPRDHIELLTQIHVLDTALRKTRSTHIDRYPINMPYKAKNSHKGGGNLSIQQLERVKKLVKSNFGKKKN
jgi:hypothetical protein